MKVILIILFIPFYSLGQDIKDDPVWNQHKYKIKVVADSAIYKGNYMNISDSTVNLITKQISLFSNVISIPVHSIQKIEIAQQPGNTLLFAGIAAVLGFILTAGLISNANDINDDGKLGFFELVFSAIEGATSSNRKRRNAALIVGGAGATAAMIGVAASRKKLSLVFPVKDRSDYYKEKKAALDGFLKF